MTQGWEIAEQLDHAVEAVIDSGDCGTEPTTVIDFSRTCPRSCAAGQAIHLSLSNHDRDTALLRLPHD